MFAVLDALDNILAGGQPDRCHATFPRVFMCFPKMLPNCKLSMQIYRSPGVFRPHSAGSPHSGPDACRRFAAPPGCWPPPPSAAELDNWPRCLRNLACTASFPLTLIFTLSLTFHIAFKMALETQLDARSVRNVLQDAPGSVRACSVLPTWVHSQIQLSFNPRTYPWMACLCEDFASLLRCEQSPFTHGPQTHPWTHPRMMKNAVRKTGLWIQLRIESPARWASCCKAARFGQVLGKILGCSALAQHGLTKCC